ncbi:MAG TPA: right-handed parallel beta-helix repeat-containing protein, partial [Anaerohalosphaeraceae bacterium]|nr:right-handed parallel beta-helix repeat-containing protein [Anaerohalosphaeraceae bacterium]
EINVRRAVFYPDKPGINYITVRGFTLMQAATPWAPPTAEQVGLIGTHWSKGWIIENNNICYSTCVGITLGKYGDEFDNTVSTAEGYVETIQRALQNGWNKETIGGHMVRNNTISHCEQGGIIGSLGAVFSTITQNVIHDIHVRGLFSGFEMAGIKIHGAIDMEISRNHIYRSCRGIWLDWMAQGTRVTGNLLHDNGLEDFYPEVNHGPFVVDNNLFLSRTALRDWSQGGAYAHNLFAGRMTASRVQNRETPFHKAHSTEIAGMKDIQCGDNRFYYNIFVGGEGLAPYDKAVLPVHMAGNVFLHGAMPSVHEKNALVKSDYDPGLELIQDGQTVMLTLSFTPPILDLCTRKDMTDQTDSAMNQVNTRLLGKTVISELAFLNCDGSELNIDTDYFGQKRDQTNPCAGPFEKLTNGNMTLQVWE